MKLEHTIVIRVSDATDKQQEQKERDRKHPCPQCELEELKKTNCTGVKEE
jgi:hypothetical protein